MARTVGMPFEIALQALKEGERIARAGWNGKGMYLFLLETTPLINVRRPFPMECTSEMAFEMMTIRLAPHIVMKTADDKFVPWLASQTDLLANDWEIVQ